MAEDEIPQGVQENGENLSEQPRWLTERPEYGDFIMGSTTAEKSLGIILFHLSDAQGYNDDGTTTGTFIPSTDAPHDTLPWHIIRGENDDVQWSKVIVGDLDKKERTVAFINKKR